MNQLLPPVTLLLLVSPDIRAADIPKSVVLLDPPWDRVLEEDNVTLKCQGSYHLGNNSTQWLHNGSLISIQSSKYSITRAGFNDSGEYRCQNSHSSLSNPVHLQVHAGWLLLQASQWVLKEGEPIRLRCHSWKNKPVRKVTYLRNGKGQKYFHKNSEFYIPKTTQEHNGSYFCRGLIGTNNKSSETADIFIQAGSAVTSISPFFSSWHKIIFYVVMGFLLAVNTGLYFSVWRELQSLKGDGRIFNIRWSRGPENK